MDVNVLSLQLLESLANSIHDRGNKDFCFNIAEIHVTEKWMHELINDILATEIKKPE